MARRAVRRGGPNGVMGRPVPTYRLTPYEPEFDAQMEEARRIMKKRRNVLRELAK